MLKFHPDTISTKASKRSQNMVWINARPRYGGGTGGVGFQKEELPIGTLKISLIWYDFNNMFIKLWWMIVDACRVHNLGNLQLFGVWTNVEVPPGYNFNQSEQAFAKHGLNHSCLTMCSPVVFVGL